MRRTEEAVWRAEDAAVEIAAKAREVRRLAGELGEAREAVSRAGEEAEEASARQMEAVRARAELASAREELKVERAARAEEVSCC